MPPGDSAEQKTEKPTRRRRERAKEQGMVAQSAEVNNALVLLAGLGALTIFGAFTFRQMAGEMAGRLGRLYGPELSLGGARGLLCDSARTVARAALPLMVFTGMVGLLVSLVQTGIVVTPARLKPDLSHVDPIQGLKRLFSLSALVRLLLAVVKLVAIALIVFFLVRSRLHWLLALTGKSTWGILEVSRRLCSTMAFRIIVAMMGLAALDYAYQRHKLAKQLMMSKTELKEEHKRDEGDPEVKARQEQLRRARARSRMMQAVPGADVVVANPTHVAVALRWDEEGMDAPQVVAKGRDWLARRIKEIARRHQVPVVERKVLAHALYEAVEVGMQIPPKLYYAVAEVLAFVMRRRSA
ncbi:MAG: flagellar biosynthesis protein FlhB [Planctomycetota bacterium]|jgi:flagellar biosynthetic protein FlhB